MGTGAARHRLLYQGNHPPRDSAKKIMRARFRAGLSSFKRRSLGCHRRCRTLDAPKHVQEVRGHHCDLLRTQSMHRLRRASGDGHWRSPVAARPPSCLRHCELKIDRRRLQHPHFGNL